MRMPDRTQILQAVDQFERRDPELYRELRQKAQAPDHDEDVFPAARRAAEILEELAPAGVIEDARRLRRREATVTEALERGPAPFAIPEDEEITAYERRVAETIVRPNARPVLVVRDNKVTTEFLGPDSDIWAARIGGARGILDVVIPAIGRV